MVGRSSTWACARCVQHPFVLRLTYSKRAQHAKGWPPALDPTLEEFRVHPYCDEDIVDVLRKGSVDPAEIKRIIYRCVLVHHSWRTFIDPFP